MAHLRCKSHLTPRDASSYGHGPTGLRLEEVPLRTLTRQHQALTAWTGLCFIGAMLTEALHLILA